MGSIYKFCVKDADLNEISMSHYKDKVILIVNVASYCGLTYQYESLERIYKENKNMGFEILAFPCNQFAFQEPGNNEEIVNFCSTKYDVTFKIFNKIKVNGKNADPLFDFLKKEYAGVLGSTEIKWNFTKFLVGKDGNVINRYSPQTDPQDIERDLIKIL
tara:strand:- start:2546 stop:3025 length:480 start_codon:yes stop_codon:yes gene_type:complete